MATVISSIDLGCAPVTDPFEPDRTAPYEPTERPCRTGSSWRAIAETIGLLASMHDGLHRDENGTWWTGDWSLRIATTQDRGRWLLLNEIARALGFEA